jgi:hydrogenase maturation protease
MNELAGILDGVYVGRTAIVGVGNTERADDGAGVAAARALAAAGVPHVFEGGTTPERLTAALREGDYDTVVFIDAVDAGCAAGSVMVFDATQVRARYPQVSTHKISLGTIAQMISRDSAMTVWLVGIQPSGIALSGAALSPVVDRTVQLIVDFFTSAARGVHPAVEEHVCT